MEIEFTFEGIVYKVSKEAYYKRLPIQLPDGRLLRVKLWLESMPPQADELEVLETGYVGDTAPATLAG